MTELAEILETSKYISKSSIVPPHLRGEGELVAAMLFVKEMGLPMISGLHNVVVVDGRPTLNSHLLWALVAKQKDLKGVKIETNDNSSTVQISRSIGDFKVSFSMEDAKKAGLIRERSGWVKYPKQMLEARAKSLCARLAYPEALFGVQSTEELKEAPSFNSPAVEEEMKVVEVTQESPTDVESIESEEKIKDVDKKELLGNQIRELMGDLGLDNDHYKQFEIDYDMKKLPVIKRMESYIVHLQYIKRGQEEMKEASF